MSPVSEPFQELANLDKLVHEPARLAITAALESCREADFLYLQRVTGLSPGNLSSHLTKLENGGIVQVRKELAGKRTETWIQLTAKGRAAVMEHWSRLERLRPGGGPGRPSRYSVD